MMELQTCKILSSCFRCIAYVFLFIMCLPFICFKRLLCFELQICEIISRCFLFIMGLPFIFFKRLLCFLNDPECPSCEQNFPSWEPFYKHVCPQQTGPQMLADILCYIDWWGATGYAEKNKRKKQIAKKYKFQFGRLYDCSWVGALNAAKRLRTQLNRAYFESIFGTVLSFFTCYGPLYFYWLDEWGVGRLRRQYRVGPHCFPAKDARGMHTHTKHTKHTKHTH